MNKFNQSQALYLIPCTSWLQGINERADSTGTPDHLIIAQPKTNSYSLSSSLIKFGANVLHAMIWLINQVVRESPERPLATDQQQALLLYAWRCVFLFEEEEAAATAARHCLAGLPKRGLVAHLLKYCVCQTQQPQPGERKHPFRSVSQSGRCV